LVFGEVLCAGELQPANGIAKDAKSMAKLEYTTQMGYQENGISPFTTL
jgi:hypothetical protein